jgi:tRNA G26 N,N-dimethylase Trm1
MLDINLLVIDTEGYDFQILKEIDLDKISPKVIHFEHGVYSQTMSLSEISIVIARLNSHGYQVMLDNNDGIAVKTDFLIEFVLAKKVS